MKSNLVIIKGKIVDLNNSVLGDLYSASEHMKKITGYKPNTIVISSRVAERLAASMMTAGRAAGKSVANMPASLRLSEYGIDPEKKYWNECSISSYLEKDIHNPPPGFEFV